MPLLAPTVATPVLLLLHTPPLVLLLSVVAEPAHTDAVPVIDESGLTVTTVVAIQPAPVVYVMIAVPELAPVTTPVVDPIAAIAPSLLLQVPPDVASLRVDDEPVQIPVEPVMAEGSALTVTTIVVRQPVLNV